MNVFASSLLHLGADGDRAPHWDRRRHHGVLVSHQQHRHSALGALSRLAVPRHVPQLLHMERQCRGERGVGGHFCCHTLLITLNVLFQTSCSVSLCSCALCDIRRFIRCHDLPNVLVYCDLYRNGFFFQLCSASGTSYEGSDFCGIKGEATWI